MVDHIVPTLHSENTVYQTAQLRSWLLLAFSAGAVNAGAFLATNRFAGHMTGTVTLIGIDFDNPVLLLEYSLVFGAFILGAAVPVLILGISRRNGNLAPYWVPLALETLLLVALAFLGQAGWLGELSREIETRGDFFLLAMIAFSMGMQNALVSFATKPPIRTTHLTGDTTDLAVELSMAAFEKGETRRQALQAAKLRFGKIVTFILGAMVMTITQRKLEYLAFLLPAATVAIAATQSFAHLSKRETKQQAAA
jgi:uncharacterized membrane protein YoaK (UPF0700 family)